VRLIAEIIEPYHGLILDPACGSGGMFVQSARFVMEHSRDASAELSIHGMGRARTPRRSDLPDDEGAMLQQPLTTTVPPAIRRSATRAGRHQRL
jgi:hypothetical protein